VRPAACARPKQAFVGGPIDQIYRHVPQTVKLMKKAGKIYEANTYDRADHGFMRVGEAPEASTADQQARDVGWRR
jgi:carboxymethylenebutenolidase